jgi:hypothetical protein
MASGSRRQPGLGDGRADLPGPQSLRVVNEKTDLRDQHDHRWMLRSHGGRRLLEGANIRERLKLELAESTSQAEAWPWPYRPGGPVTAREIGWVSRD